MKPTKLILWIAALACGVSSPAFAAAGPWDRPAATLAAKISDVLGPGPARVTLQNLSSVPADQVTVIRKLLLQDLKAHGISNAGTESANVIRITLSQNTRARLWVAEIVQGTDTRVAMVGLDAPAADPPQRAGSLVLRMQSLLTLQRPVLAALETGTALLILEPNQLDVYTRAADQWQMQQHASIDAPIPLARDPHGLLQPTSAGVDAWTPGAHCTASAPSAPVSSSWAVDCRASDDPWSIESTPALHAFYNSARNYFTGVVTPDPGSPLPPFYSIAVLPAQEAVMLLIGGIDGKVRLAANGALQSVAGTRDWGSDFAPLQSGCGAGTQVVVSGSGDTTSDSLRAYEVHQSEAQPASEPLDIQGTVTALMPAPDRKSVVAVVRTAQNDYEVDRVTAFCN